MQKKALGPPGVGLLSGLAAAIAWGVVCGVPRAPFLVVAIGGLAAAGLAMRLDWAALTRPVPGRKIDIRALLAAAYVFLAIIGVGLASVGYFAGEWLRAKL
jgi:hypothetical protein